MTLKVGNRYKHYGNGRKYDFLCIALPNSVVISDAVKVDEVFHTERKEFISLYSMNGIYLTELNEFLVIYYDGSHTTYARPVDMFFQYAKNEFGELVPRFEQLTDKIEPSNSWEL